MDPGGQVGCGRSMNPPGRFWLGVLVALLVSLPFCWLLSFAALLPFYIGLFFFALFGLVFGAVVCRIAGPRAPYGSGTVLTGTTLLVFAAWGGSIAKESWDLPADLAEQALRRSREINGQTPAEFRAAVAAEVTARIAEEYPPGGPIGYVRWALAGGAFKKGELASANVSLKLNQTRYIFAGRLVLSIGLLAFGIASQTLGLRTTRAAGAASSAISDTGQGGPPDRAASAPFSSAGTAENKG